MGRGVHAPLAPTAPLLPDPPVNIRTNILHTGPSVLVIDNR